MTFRRCIAFFADHHRCDIGRLKRERGYRDFELDLDSFQSPGDLAAFAIAELCEGSPGVLDDVVADAVIDFLEQCCPDMTAGPTGWILQSKLPMDAKQARAWIRKEYGI